jgi:hypothetical protein
MAEERDAHCGRDNFDLKHYLEEVAHVGVKDCDGEQLGEAAFHDIHLGRFWLAAAKKSSIAAAASR